MTLSVFRNRLLSVVAALLLVACGCNDHCPQCSAADRMPLTHPDYVGIDDGRFVLNGEPWFPLMLNYKAYFDWHGDTLEVVPAPWYTGDDIGDHFDTIAAWGFNAVRICLDVVEQSDDTLAMWQATRQMVQRAGQSGLHVMLLIRPPFEGYWHDYAAGLFRLLADLPTLWAYDLMNEPLYFDPQPQREKLSAVDEVCRWRTLVRDNAPYQLFTVATAEPIEVFEWDPSMLPVDFVEMHTYHPLRVQSEMWWYAHYCGRPWMVGETGLPADGPTVDYRSQSLFMRDTYRYACEQGAIGYGWWEFQDCPEGVSFEAQYTGLRDRDGRRKPAVETVRQLHEMAVTPTETPAPVGYSNMLAYDNLTVVGYVVDEAGNAIEGAVLRGWNVDWSVGVNTYSDASGHFRLVSNDICVHYELSAPHHTKIKFDYNPSFPASLTLQNRDREYQQIGLTGWGNDTSPLPTDAALFAAPSAVEASLGTLVLQRYQ